MRPRDPTRLVGPSPTLLGSRSSGTSDDGKAARPVTVVAAADSAYALPLAVTLRSVVDHLGPDQDLEVFVVDNGLEPTQRKRVEQSLEGSVVPSWVDPHPLPDNGLPLCGRMSSTTYQKLSLPRVLPHGTERVIWLDSDLLILADLGELWDLSMDGNAVLAATDPFVEVLSSGLGLAGWQELELPADAPYFNAGVLVVDLCRWQRDDVAERAHDYLRRFGDNVVFHDQEALNAALVGAWGVLEDRWNRSVAAEHLSRQVRSAPPSILHY